MNLAFYYCWVEVLLIMVEDQEDQEVVNLEVLAKAFDFVKNILMNVNLSVGKVVEV